MQIKAIFFDLDGTLLPMDQEVFTKGYFHLLAGKLAPYGYQPQPLIDAIWSGTAAMVKNDGSRRNEEAFWQKFYSIFGEKSLQDKPLFEEFYRCEGAILLRLYAAGCDCRTVGKRAWVPYRAGHQSDLSARCNGDPPWLGGIVAGRF